MKPTYLFYTIIILCLGFEVKGQTFEIPIYFVDAAGLRDTIVVGYDVSGTYGIDPSLEEVDILDSAYSKPMEVRAAMYDYYFEWPSLLRIIESKKMMIGYVCFDPYYFDEAHAIMIVIKSNNWPVTLSWDKTLFQDECDKMYIIDCTPGGWFDVCGPGHPYSLIEMPLTGTATYFDSEFRIETGEDTLRTLFLKFYEFGSGIEDASKPKVEIFPNPSQSSFQLDYALSSGDKIYITDLMGKPVLFTCHNKQIELIDAPDGMYIVTVKLDTGVVISKRVLKISY